MIEGPTGETYGEKAKGDAHPKKGATPTSPPPEALARPEQQANAGPLHAERPDFVLLLTT
jgi:hypothetical protein